MVPKEQEGLVPENHPTPEDLHRARKDPSGWEDEPTEITVAPRKSEVVSFRLPSDELDQLEEAAAAAGETLSEYIRRALRALISGSVATRPGIDVMAGTCSSIWVLTPPAGGSARTDGSEQLRGFPPLRASDPAG